MPTAALLSWNDTMRVGNDVIDAEHHVTVDQLATLAICDDTAFPALFAEFADHLRDHFAHEEALMTENGFPAYPIHRHEHQRVLTELEGIGKRLAAGNLALARGYVREMVPQWFITHKNSMDAATAAWIRQQRG